MLIYPRWLLESLRGASVGFHLWVLAYCLLLSGGSVLYLVKAVS